MNSMVLAVSRMFLRKGRFAFWIAALLVTLLAPLVWGQTTFPTQIGVEVGDRPTGFIDAFKDQGRLFIDASGNSLASDANGNPLSDGIAVIFDGRPTPEWLGYADDPAVYQPDVSGTYTISFTGQATLANVSGAPVLTFANQVYNAVTNTTTVSVTLPGGATFADGAALMEISFTNTKLAATSATNTGIANLQVIRPGFTLAQAADPAQTFDPAFVTAFAPFGYMRFMGWLGTNTNPFVANSCASAAPACSTVNTPTIGWSERSLPTDFFQGVGPNSSTNSNIKRGAWGISWEYVILLANATNKDIWINVPINATGSPDPYDPSYVASPDTSSYIYNLATLLKNGDAATGNVGLKAGLHIYIENSNEVWNWSFMQSAWNESAAQAEVAAAPSQVSVLNNDGNTSTQTWAYRRHIKRVYEIGQIFQSVFGSGSLNTTIRPVYAWWNLDEGAGSNAADALAWFKTNYGAPANSIYGMAQGDYFDDPNYATDATIPEVISSMAASSTSVAQYVKAGVATAAQYGLPLFAYEGGPASDNTGTQNTTNVGVQILANRDPGMGTLVQDHIRTNWFGNGGGLFGYFGLSGAYSRYGDWGATDDYRNLATAKYNALVNLTGYEPSGLPFAPGDLVATAGNTAVGLSWSAVPGASNYKVLRGTASGGETLLSTVSSTTYQDTAVTNGVPYYYEVAGVNSTGTGEVSNEASATPVAAAPSAPTLTGSAGNTQAVLSWTAAPGAVSYNIFQASTSGAESATPIATGVTTTAYTVTGLTNGASYYFEVAAVNTLGTGAVSNEATVVPVGPPPAPTGLSAVSGNSQSVLSWTASTGATSYNVYEGTASGAEATTPVATGVSATAYTVTGLTDETTYYFTVAAVNANGTSGSSNEATSQPARPNSLLAYEPFGEASGTVLQGNSGGGDFGWASAWVDQNGSGHIPGHDVESSTPVAYTGLVESGNYAVGGDTWDYVGRQLDTSATGPFAAYLSNGLIGAPGQTVWLSFLLRADVATPDVSFSLGSQGGTNAWWIGNPNLEFGYFGSLSQDSSGHPYWSLAYGGSYATPTAVVPTTVPVTVGQTELFVASINYGADGTDTVNLYMNPSTLGGTAPTTPSVTYTTTNSLAFESLTYYGGTGYNMSSLDEIRLGTSFAAVTPAAPVVIPTVPASLTATPGSGSVTLSWTAVSGATSYNVYQSTTSGGEGSAPVAIGITGTTYTATGLTNGKPYYFEVAAVNSAGIGAISSEATATPSYMAGLPGVPVLAASAGNGQATLSWTAASGASSYNIYEATAAGGEGSTPIATGITDTSYTATGLTNETTYFFQVSATNSVGTSKLSNEVTATPAPPVAGNNAPAIFNIYPQVVADSPVKAGFNMQPASGANITENAWIADGGFSPYDERMSFTASQDGTTTTFIAQYPQPGTDFWSSIVTGYFNGATARTYRYSGGAWSLLRTDTVANYAANGEDETAANNTITFASSGPQILAGDITWLDLDNQASIPSLAYYDARFTAYCPTWMIETQACNTRTSTMPITLSTDVPASDAGGLSLEFTDTNTETNGIRQYVQGAFVGSSYEQFQPGHTYTVDVWLKQSGTNGNVTFFIDSIGVTHTFTGVTDSWKEFTWSFPAVAGLPAGSAQPSVHLDINAPGTMWVDNFQLYDAAWAPNTVSPQAMQAWQNYQPGTVRIWSNFGNSSQNYSFLSLDSWLTPEIKTRNTPGVGNQYEVPAELEHLPDALANVKSIGTANPWLIVNMALSEVEWGELIDYLAAPAGTGYAAKRPANHPGPYTDDFSTIYLEVGNEEWGTQTVPADTAYGAWAHFVLSNAIAGKSYFSASKIKFIANGFDLEPNFGSAAAAAAPEISVVDAALYTQGDQTLTGDAYYQSDLIQVPASNGPIIDALAAQQQLDATKGLNYALASYEQGPGSDTATHQGDTTLAAAIGAIDVNLYATMRGFGPQNLYMYQLGTGPYTSHTNFANGFRPHPVWEALQMRNNYTSGPMVLTTASSVPTTTGSSAYPLIAVYTFRDATVKNQADVVVLSRDLNNQTPVTLNFPATPTGTATLYTLTGDPRVGNDAVLNVPITSTTVSGVTSSYTFNMPPGSMYIFQVPLSSEWSTTGQPTPAAPDSLTASAGNGKVTLTWTASTGATGYYVLRATTTGGPYTQIATSSAVAFTDSTVTNGTTYYYVVQAYNSGGVSGNSDEASATPNVENAAQATATPPLDGSDTGAWANAPFVPISHQFSGDSTDTAAYKVLWDANNLYVLVSVQDSYLIAPTEANIWSGETVELYFSGTDSTSTTYGLTDFQYAFPYGSGGAVITEADHSPSSLTGVTLGQQNITGGFQMAMALPWKTLGTTPVAGKQYGFDLMIDTASVQGTRLGKLGWWATADSTWGNPSLMGPLVLSQAQQTAQTINFTAPSAATYGSTITLSATATSALSPVFTVLSGPATLNGSQLTFTGVGSVVVQASQSGNSTFAAATPVTQTIVVTAATPAITWATPSAITYGTKLTATQLNATTTVAGKFTYSPAVGALLNAGSQTLSASFKPTNATDYTNATASVQLTVNQAKPSLAFSAIASKSYGSAPFKVRASSASSGVVTYSVTSGPATISGSTVTLTGVGLVTLLASQAATTNYTSATSSTSFSVSAETPKLTFSSIPSKVYGSAPFTVKAASASSGVITYSIVSGPALINSSTGLVTLTGLGKVTVEASQAASGVYAATSVTSGFTVTAGTPKLAFASIAAKTYGNAAFTVSASSASSGEVSYKVTSGPATLSGSKVTLTGAGTVHLLASQAATSTYKAATATISIPVAKATPKVTLKASVDSIKLGAPCAFTATLSGVQRGVVPTGSVNFYNGATLLRTVSIRSGVAYYSTQKLPAGSDKITAVYKGNVNYLKATSNAVTISVIAK